MIHTIINLNTIFYTNMSGAQSYQNNLKYYIWKTHTHTKKRKKKKKKRAMNLNMYDADPYVQAHTHAHTHTLTHMYTHARAHNDSSRNWVLILLITISWGGNTVRRGWFSVWL